MKESKDELHVGDWVRCDSQTYGLTGLYEMMHSGWYRGKEQLRNRIAVKIEFDDSVPEHEREAFIQGVCKFISP